MVIHWVPLLLDHSRDLGTKLSKIGEGIRYYTDRKNINFKLQHEPLPGNIPKVLTPLY